MNENEEYFFDITDAVWALFEELYEAARPVDTNRVHCAMKYLCDRTNIFHDYDEEELNF